MIAHIGLILLALGVQAPAIQPTPEMAPLAFMVGRFDVIRRDYRPAGSKTEAHDHATGSWMPGGRHLRLVFEEDGRESQSIVFGYDPLAHNYHLWSFVGAQDLPIEITATIQGGGWLVSS